jgi:replicative DNA helicase
MEDIGGGSYLSKLLEVPVSTNTEFSCRKLKKYSQLRQLIEISNAITKRCFQSNSEGVEKIIDYAQSEILRIDSGNNNTFRHVNEIIVECIEHCETISQKGGVTGVPSGYVDLDAHTCGFQPGDLILVAGRTSMGKTALALSCILNAADSGFKSGMCSLEMADIQLGNRLISSESRVNSLKFRSGRFNQDDWHTLTNAAGKLSSYDIWIDDSPQATYQDIQRKARFAKKNYGIQILWIDYLGFIDGEKDNGRVQEIQSISRALKALAKELYIPVVLVCQLSRACEQRTNKRPILSDLRESGALEQDADVVCFIYRDEVYNKDENSPHRGIAEIIIAKQRNGPTGTIRLAWRESITRFENLSLGED